MTPPAALALYTAGSPLVPRLYLGERSTPVAPFGTSQAKVKGAEDRGATLTACTSDSHRLRVRSDIEGPLACPLEEGTAEWSATGLENRGGVTARGSIPLPSAPEGEPARVLASPAKRPAPHGVGIETSAFRQHGSDAPPVEHLVVTQASSDTAGSIPARPTTGEDHGGAA